MSSLNKELAMSTMTPSKVLQRVYEAVYDGDSLVEIAEQFKDDDDVVEHLPKLAAILEDLDAAAARLVAYLDME
jgi:hypothetical protein